MLKKLIVTILAVSGFVFSIAAMSMYASANEQLSVYFGDIHNHTSYSDGKLKPFDAFSYVKNNNLGDFFAITDHNTLLSQSEWDDIRRQADNFTDKNFVAIAGWEGTFAWGHMNVYNTDWYVNNYFLKRINFYKDLQSHSSAIASWNHPTQYSDEFDEFADISDSYKKSIKLIEIVNGSDTYEPSYLKALSKGWKVSPSATLDHHSTKWMSASENRIAVYAKSLTRENIFDAIRKNRVYATQDKNLLVNFKINGRIMGETLSVDGGKNLKISIKAEDPDVDKMNDAIYLIEVVDNTREIVMSKECTDHSEVLEGEITYNNQQFFYARVTNYNNKIAYTSPIWIN